MTTENKFLIGIGIVTIVIIIGGVFVFGKNTPKKESADPNFNTSALTENAVYFQGKVEASVKIVEFADLQCPACKQAQPIVEKVMEKYKDEIYFVFRHYPLSTHRNAKLAAQAAEAAGKQDKFFEMVHVQYDKQGEWAEKTNPREEFRKYAQELNLSMDQFNQNMEEIKKPIEEDYALGNRAGVQSTPTFFINGEKYPGVIQQEQIQQIIESIIQNQGQK